MTAALLVLLVGFLLRSGRLANLIRLAAALILVLVMTVLLLLAFGNALPYQDRLASILEPEGYAVRFKIWGTALRAWRDHPLWGTGLGSSLAKGFWPSRWGRPRSIWLNPSIRTQPCPKP